MNFWDLFILWNMRRITLRTEEKRQLSKERSSRKKVAEILVNRKNTMTVCNIYQLKGHGSSAFHRILIAASRTETAVATKRNKLQMFTMRAKVHGTTIRRIPTVDHLIDIFPSQIFWDEEYI